MQFRNDQGCKAMRMGLRKGISSAPTAQVKGATDIPDYVAPVSSSPEAKMVMKSKPTPSSDFKSAEPKPAPAELSSPEPADTGEETVSGKMVMKTKPTSLPPASRPSKMVMRQPKLQVSKMSMATSLPSFNQIAPPAPPASEPRYLMNEEGKTNIGQKVKLKPIEEVVSPCPTSKNTTRKTSFCMENMIPAKIKININSADRIP